MKTLILDRSSALTLMAYQGRTLTLDGRDDTWVAQLKDFLQGSRPEALAVGLGPGSFAGVRAAIACLQGLGIAWGLQPRGFASAAALAAVSGLEEVTVVGDARRNTLWTVRYRVTPEAIQPLSDFVLRRRDTFVPDASMVSPDAERLTCFGLPKVTLDAACLESVVNRLGAGLTLDPKPLYLHPAVGVAHAE
jgi:tRNA A37 threonylcarbamoyladenosine modification protein TsaB